jgi:hypothetical protein
MEVKIFGKKGQAVVKSVYIQAPMNYFLNIQCHGLITVHFHFFNLPISTKQRHLPLTTTTYSDGSPSPALGQAQL